MIEIIIVVYLSCLVGSRIGIMLTEFISPKGLWILVPFRVSGWKDCDNKIYKINWVWSRIDQSTRND